MGEPALFNTEALVSLIRQAVRDELRAAAAEKPPAKPEAAAPEWLTIAEAAAHLKVHHNTISKWIKSRALPAKRIGRGWRIARADLDVCLASGGPPSAEYNPQLSAAKAMARLRHRRSPR